MLRLLSLLALLPLLTACGFTPLYATNEASGASPLREVRLASVSASDQLAPAVERAFERRLAAPGSTGAEYDLVLNVTDRSQRLAVQIDSSVTRYNYRVLATYTLSHRTSGKTLRGRAESVTSFNIVSSQYSTLYAENAAREKAARSLAEEVERDILLKLAAEREKEALALSAKSK